MKINYLLAVSAAVAFVFIQGCALKSAFVIPGKYNSGFIEADNSNIQYFGRWDFSKRKSPSADWGAVYLKTKFEGTSCRIVLVDGQTNLGDYGTGNYYQYSIDGKPFENFPATKETIYTLAENLADGPHELTFARRTESKWGKTTIGGFILDEGRKLLDPGPRPARKVEIVGDSITAGLANENTGWFRHETQNGYMSWGPQAARLLSAEWNVEARGGAYLMAPGGDYENYCMQKFFPGTYQSQEEPLWNFKKWQPDVFILALGTNDFSDTAVTNKEEFSKQYGDFVLMIREKYPRAEIFCTGPWKEGVPWDYCRKWIKETVDKLGDKNVHAIDPVGDGKDLWLSFPKDYVINDQYHPNIDGNTKIAKRMADIIAKEMSW